MLGHPSKLNLLVQFFSHLLFLALPFNPLVLSSLPFLVLLFLRDLSVINTVDKSVIVAFPMVDWNLFFADYNLILGTCRRTWGKIRVRKRVKIIVNLFKSLQNLLLKLIVFVITQSQIIFKLSFI